MRVFVNVVLLLTTVTKTSWAITLIHQFITAWYQIDCECGLRHHSVVYMPATKKSTKKAIKIAFLRLAEVVGFEPTIPYDMTD